MLCRTPTCLQEGTRTWSAPEVVSTFADSRHAVRGQPRVSPKADVCPRLYHIWSLLHALSAHARLAWHGELLHLSTYAFNNHTHQAFTISV